MCKSREFWIDVAHAAVGAWNCDLLETAPRKQDRIESLRRDQGLGVSSSTKAQSSARERSSVEERAHLRLGLSQVTSRSLWPVLRRYAWPVALAVTGFIALAIVPPWLGVLLSSVPRWLRRNTVLAFLDMALVIYPVAMIGAVIGTAVLLSLRLRAERAAPRIGQAACSRDCYCCALRRSSVYWRSRPAPRHGGSGSSRVLGSRSLSRPGMRQTPPGRSSRPRKSRRTFRDRFRTKP